MKLFKDRQFYSINLSTFLLLICFASLSMATALFADFDWLDKLSEEIQRQYPQATFIRQSDFSDEVKKRAKPPELVTGDFDCNGLKDTALLIYNESRIKFIVVHRFKDKESAIIEISKTGELPLDSIQGHYEDFLTLMKKGQRVEFYCDCDNDDTNYEDQELYRKYADRKSERGCSLKLDCDAIEEIYFGKAAVLYYFDKKNNKYLSVITAD